MFFDIGDTLGEVMMTTQPVERLSLVVFPHVLPVLQRLREQGFRLGLISNTGNSAASLVNDALSRAHILQFFEPQLRVYSSEVGADKSSPEIFLLAAQRASADPSACLFVGEDARERITARDAGFAVCPHPTLVQDTVAGARLQFRISCNGTAAPLRSKTD